MDNSKKLTPACIPLGVISQTMYNTSNTSDTNQFYVRTGFFFPGGGIVLGALIALFGLVMFITSILAKDLLLTQLCTSIFVMLFGLTFFSTKHILIDRTKHTIEEQTKCLGYKFKSQKDLDNFKFVTILRQLYSVKSRTVYSPDVESTFYRFDVILLNSNHLLKQKMGTYNDLAKAQEFAQKLSNFLSIDIVKFNPSRRQSRRNSA